jgi:hypothetical protein
VATKRWKEHCSKTFYAYSTFFVFQIEESFENFYNEENSFQGVVATNKTSRCRPSFKLQTFMNAVVQEVWQCHTSCQAFESLNSHLLA